MSVLNQINDGGWFTQLLMRRLNMTGDAPAPALMPEVGPVLTLENDRPEWGALRGESRWGRRQNCPASLGNFSLLSIFNPPGSGLICTIEQYQADAAVIVACGNASSIVSLGTIVTSGGGIKRDTRQTGFGLTWYSSTNPISPLSPTWQLAANTINQAPFIIAPGGVFLMHPTATNTGMNACILWRQRPALPGELD